jgi:hypothetical protein
MGKPATRIVRIFSILIAALAAVPAAMAQSCAMCYATASAAGPREQKSLDVGIVILLIPTLTLFIGVFILLIRRAHAAAA